MNFKKKYSKQDLISKINKCNLSASDKAEIIKVVESSENSVMSLMWKVIQLTNLGDKVLDNFVDD